jgi:hypothetical protein
METKLQKYFSFNETYPSFGGFLPCFASDTLRLKPYSYLWPGSLPPRQKDSVLKLIHFSRLA